MVKIRVVGTGIILLDMCFGCWILVGMLEKGRDNKRLEVSRLIKKVIIVV